MTPGQNCSNCRAFAALEGQCRRHAPIPVPTPGQGGILTYGVWPATNKDNWCGEWLSEETVH